ncbi:MAG: Na+/H+ antiporter subunit B [Acidobacteriota bacterium]
MESVLLRGAAILVVPVQLVLSVFLLLRGHNEPGGGFIGGLVAAGAILLWGISRDFDAARRMLWLQPETWLGLGVLVAVGSAFAGPVAGLPVLTGLWAGEIPGVPLLGDVKLGTPLYFDLGVYLVVVGVVTRMAFSLAEAD